MFTYQHDGEIYSVQLERLPDGSYHATIGDRTYQFSAEAIEGGWLLSFPDGGNRTRAYTVVDGDNRLIHLNGESYALTRETPRKRRSAAHGAHSGDVTAQMPGQVREVLIAESDAVERGQALVILEAMKMEVRATSPADGTVKRVLVAAGDVVSRGQLLVQIE
jgi:3-methylcrotonyl-CoA carboxylase alpha subunit